MSDPDARLRRLQEQAALVLAGDGFDADPTAAATIAELIEQLVIHQTELRIQNAELEAAQATASAALARYAALFDSLPLPAVVLDREAVVRIANPAAADLFDRPGPSDVEGLALLGRLDAAARPRFLATLASSGQGPARVSDVGLLVDHVPTAAGLGDPVPHDVYLLALRGEAVDHRSLALFVDRASDAEAARLAEVDAALLELRRAAHDASPSALRVAAVRQLERLSGCERCAWFLVQDDAPEPELLAWSPTVSRSVMTAPAVLDAVGRALAAAAASPVPPRPRAGGGTGDGAASAPGPSCVVVGAPGRQLVAVVAGGPRRLRGTTAAAVTALGEELSLLLHLQQGQRDLARLSQALEQSSDAVVLTDARGLVTYVNASFARLCGVPAAAALSRDLVEVFGGATTAMAHGWRTLESSDSWQGEVTAPHAQDSDGPLHATISALRDARGRVEQYVVWLVDLSERRQAQQQIHQLAYFDALTGLPNRRYLGYRVQQAVAAFGRTKVRSVVLFIDLDGFKDVNDSLGHDLGDLLLCAVAERIGHCVRDVDTVARLGGDEFVVLLPDISPTSAGACAAAEAVAARIAEEVARPLEIEGNRLSTTPSIGIAVVDASTPSADHLLRHADLAMYQAKAAGRNTVRFFDPSMQAQAEARTTLTTALRRAVDDGDLQLYLQPQIDVDRRVVGMEALLRWPHPVRGLVPPSTFIPLAEETGLIAAVGDWVLTQACTTLAQWASVPERSQLTLAVNVSARQLRGVDLAERVCQVLTETGAPPERLELELTESVFLHDVDEAVEVLTRLRDLGVRIALDDFGTGYSCLAYLRRLPLSKLKIDQRFVAGVPTSAPDGEIIRAIIAMVHSLGLPVLAEGVETEEQQAFLAEGGCDYFQGYLHGRPAPLA